jgi:hypothetical protein
MSVPTDVSDTDLAIFQHLANPRRVDFNQGSRAPVHNAPPPIMEMDETLISGDDYHQLKTAEPLHISVGLGVDPPPQPNEVDRYPLAFDVPPNEPSPAPSPRGPSIRTPRDSSNEHVRNNRQSNFADRVHQQLQSRNDKKTTEKKPFVAIRPAAVPIPSGAPSPRMFRSAGYTPKRVGPAPPPVHRESGAKYPMHQPQPIPVPLAAQASISEEQLRMMHANATYPGEEDDSRRIKQRLMIEVAELERNGYVFARRPTLEDTVEEIQFEIDHGHSTVEMKQAVNFIRDGIPMVYNLLEMGNNKWGPFLPIQGFTDELLEKMDKNPQRYNYVLERVYRRYWRKGSMSPAMEFIWVFIAPLILYMGKRKIFGPKGGNGAGSRASATAMAPEPVRHTYSNEPMNMGMRPSQPPPQKIHVPDNGVGASVRPQPPPTGNFFPPAMMVQPPLPPQPTKYEANVQAQQTSSGRRKLRPPSHGAFNATQAPLTPVKVSDSPLHLQPQQPQQHAALPAPVALPPPRIVSTQAPIRIDVATPSKVPVQVLPQEQGEEETLEPEVSPAVNLPPICEEPDEDNDMDKTEHVNNY